MTFDDMRKWADFNREFVRQVQAAKKAGQTVEQFAQSWKAPATFQQPANEQAAAAAMKRLVANVQTIMAETK
jgi:hypothetical protein